MMLGYGDCGESFVIDSFIITLITIYSWYENKFLYIPQQEELIQILVV